MEIRYQLTPRDMAQYQATIRPRLVRLQKQNFLFGVVLGTLCGLAALAAFTAGDWLSMQIVGAELAGFSVLFGMVCGVVIMIAALWSDHLNTRATMLRPDGVVYSAHVLNIGDDGLRFAGADLFEARYRWAAIREVTELREIFVLWIEPGLGFVVPKRAFSSPAEAAGFLETVNAKVGKAQAA